RGPSRALTSSQRASRASGRTLSPPRRPEVRTLLIPRRTEALHQRRSRSWASKTPQNASGPLPRIWTYSRKLTHQIDERSLSMAAETNLITTAQMKKAREIDFVQRFTHDSLEKLIEVLGVTRRIPMMEGTTLYFYKTTGTLQ